MVPDTETDPAPFSSFDFGPPAPTFKTKEEERQYVKERLALAYRVLAKEGLCQGATGHASVRDPVDPSCFWVNPYGLHFAMMTASDLLLVTHEGKILPSGRSGRQTFNSAAFHIHSTIHTLRPEINAIIHSHTPHGKAFSTLGRPLPCYTQDAAVFWKTLGHYNEFGGVVLSAEESERIAMACGPGMKGVIMLNHGNLTVGESIESAMGWFVMLEQECGVVLAAEAAAAMSGKPPVSLEPEIAEFTERETGMDEAGRFEALPLFDLVDLETQGSYKL